MGISSPLAAQTLTLVNAGACRIRSQRPLFALVDVDLSSGQGSQVYLAPSLANGAKGIQYFICSHSCHLRLPRTSGCVPTWHPGGGSLAPTIARMARSTPEGCALPLLFVLVCSRRRFEAHGQRQAPCLSHSFCNLCGKMVRAQQASAGWGSPKLGASTLAGAVDADSRCTLSRRPPPVGASRFGPPQRHGQPVSAS